ARVRLDQDSALRNQHHEHRRVHVGCRCRRHNAPAQLHPGRSVQGQAIPSQLGGADRPNGVGRDDDPCPQRSCPVLRVPLRRLLANSGGGKPRRRAEGMVNTAVRLRREMLLRLPKAPAIGPCTRQSARCPDARDYLTELRPCCRSHLIETMSAVAEVFKEVGCKWWADYGTLLGAVRNPLTT